MQVLFYRFQNTPFHILISLKLGCILGSVVCCKYIWKLSFFFLRHEKMLHLTIAGGLGSVKYGNTSKKSKMKHIEFGVMITSVREGGDWGMEEHLGKF